MTLNRRTRQALAYLFHQSTYVIPIVGVQSVDQIKVMNDAITTKLSLEEVQSIQNAAPFEPLFPMSFLFGCKDGKGYSTRLTAGDNVQYGMWAHFDAPVKQIVSFLFRPNNISLSAYILTSQPDLQLEVSSIRCSVLSIKLCVLHRGLAATTTVYRDSTIGRVSMGRTKMKFNLGICLTGAYQ
jgi:hypothetical protein